MDRLKNRNKLVVKASWANKIAMFAGYAGIILIMDIN